MANIDWAQLFGNAHPHGNAYGANPSSIGGFVGGQSLNPLAAFSMAGGIPNTGPMGIPGFNPMPKAPEVAMPSTPVPDSESGSGFVPFRGIPGHDHAGVRLPEISMGQGGLDVSMPPGSGLGRFWGGLPGSLGAFLGLAPPAPAMSKRPPTRPVHRDSDSDSYSAPKVMHSPRPRLRPTSGGRGGGGR